ncbi:DsrE family protein [Candidatus Zixiibacteriota bacterium]
MLISRKAFASVLIAAMVVVATGFTILENTQAESESTVTMEQETETTKLGIVWTSGDRDVALKMVFMYTFNAKRSGWFDEVRLVVWGPSSKLLSEDEELQEYVGRMAEVGVVLEACKACADMYGVADSLTELGIDVKYMGQPLTAMLQGDWKVMTF